MTLDNYEEVIAEALALDLITEEDAGKIRLAQQLSQAVIDVDDFPREEIEKNYSKSGRKPKAA